MKKLLLFIAIISVSMFGSSLIQAAEVNVGVMAPRGNLKAMKRWGEVGKYLTAEIGTKIKIIPLKPSDALKAVADGKVNYALVNPVLTVAMQEKLGATPIATMKKKTGEVEHAASVIEDLKSDSQNIGGVLDVIQSIAEQTNLLALNAAIEAARAGDQGRGFAVVADEVRTLAQRTQESTTEIKEMIEKLQSGAQNAVSVMSEGKEQAQKSVDKANETGNSLEAITAAVATINLMNTQIASAAEEQNAVAEEINKNISKISVHGEETANGANKTAIASSELNGLSSELNTLMNQFKI